jgi:hypothetical protein
MKDVERDMQRSIPTAFDGPSLKYASSISGMARSAMAQLVPSVSLPGILRMPQTVMHSGTIRVEGVNDRGQLIDIIEMKIKNDLQLEMRAL